LEAKVRVFKYVCMCSLYCEPVYFCCFLIGISYHSDFCCPLLKLCFHIFNSHKCE
jgi:hypothetical protein